MVMINRRNQTLTERDVPYDRNEGSGEKSDRRKKWRKFAPLALLLVAVQVVFFGFLTIRKRKAGDGSSRGKPLIQHEGKKYVNRQERKRRPVTSRQEGEISVKGQEANKSVKEQEERNQCTVWVAPSSLKGHPGFGIFTTRDIPKGDSILRGHDGLAVPIDTSRAPSHKLKRAWQAVWNNYVWARGVPGHMSYEGSTDTMDFQVGFGALPNHHCLLHSLETRYPDPAYDDSLVNRFKDPGTGAFSYNMGRQFFVFRDLKAGDEIFLNYGYCEHGDKHTPSWTDRIFMPEDFSKATKVILNMAWKYLRGSLEYDSSGNLAPPEGTNPLVAALLPKTKAEFDEMKASVESPADLKMYLANHQGLNPRDPDWIRSNGMCLENLVPRKSTLPQAGQGAATQFPIRKGEIVVLAPLLHIMDEEALALYDEDGKREGTQLLLNYCFKHPESTLLLCPNTNAVLINHCSTRKKQCGPKGPNAEYRWSSGWDAPSDLWRRMTLEEIAEQTIRGLSFEIVALRDIQPGEEVFIDYGSEWEEAWDKHVQKWNPPPVVDPWITAKEANEKDGPVMDMFVSGDLRNQTDHPYIFTACQYEYDEEKDEDEVYERKYAKWEKLSDEDLLERFADDGRYQVRGYQGYEGHYDNSFWPCSVFKQGPRNTYTVRIHQNPWEETTPWDENNVPRFLTNYPRRGIHYFVKPYESDQHLPGVFRHPIGIRDDMFPERWKNLKNK